MTAHIPGLVYTQSIRLTHKYMTAHIPGLVYTQSIRLTHKYMTAHIPGLVYTHFNIKDITIQYKTDFTYKLY